MNNVMKSKMFVLALLGAAMLQRCGGRVENTGYEEALLVKTMTVEDGETPLERNYVGDIESEREVTLSFVLGGRLTEVRVKNGQEVKKGQLLAKVDATTAKSLHETAMATLRQAEDAWRRLEWVYKEGGLSEVKWVEMETNLEKARQAEVTARKHLEDCSLYAPFDGVVACGDHEVGQEMRPLEPFGRLIDRSQLRVTFSVPEQEVSLIAKGDEARATIPSLDNRELTLKITDKSLVANPLGHTYKVHAAMTAGVKDVLPDMVAKVRVVLKRREVGGERSEVMVVPSDCIQTMPGGVALWVVRGGRAYHTLIEVGDFVKGGVVVKSGLTAGDTIVTAGYQKLYKGARVKDVES